MAHAARPDEQLGGVRQGVQKPSGVPVQERLRLGRELRGPDDCATDLVGEPSGGQEARARVLRAFGGLLGERRWLLPWCPAVEAVPSSTIVRGADN
jgi:hypothetical protein